VKISDMPFWVRPESEYWSKPSISHYEDMCEKYRSTGLIVPFVPEHLRTQMMTYPSDRTRQGPFFGLRSTSNEVNLNDLDHLMMRPHHVVDYARPDRGDFFMEGTGMGRWRSNGFITRFGPLLLAQKSWWDVGKKDELHDNVVIQQFNHCTEAWNSTAAELQSFALEEIRVVVLYSNVGGDEYSQIWIKDSSALEVSQLRKEWEERTFLGNFEDYKNWGVSVPWKVVEGGQRDGFELRLQQLINTSDEVVAIAAKHLLSLPRHRTWAHDQLPDIFSE
jgi:hypothetical protein